MLTVTTNEQPPLSPALEAAMNWEPPHPAMDRTIVQDLREGRPHQVGLHWGDRSTWVNITDGMADSLVKAKLDSASRNVFLPPPGSKRFTGSVHPQNATALKPRSMNAYSESFPPTGA